MPSLLNEPPPLPPAPYPPRKRWTRPEAFAAQAAGMNLDKVELIEGELIRKMSSRPHSSALMMLLIWFQECFGNRFVNQEAVTDVSAEDNHTNIPEPDILVFRRDFNGFRDFPRPADLHLVAEVADSSLAFDLTTKAALYARAGIVEYWVLDVIAKRLIVHRDPADGRYASVTSYSEHERIAPLAAPDSRFLVGGAFPEVPSE